MTVKFICKNLAFMAKSVVIASIGVLFFKKWAFKKLDKNEAPRRYLYSHVKESRDNLGMNRVFLERRVKNHFSLFCAKDRIGISDLSERIPVANCNEKNGSSLRNIDLVTFAFWAGLACVLIALKVFPINKHEGYNNNMLFVGLLFVFTVLTVLNLGVLVRCKRVGKIPSKEFERLDSELKIECKQYSDIIGCVEIYNKLSSEVKNKIKHSDYLSKVVEERILSGKLTEEEGKKIEKRVAKLSTGNVGVCA